MTDNPESHAASVSEFSKRKFSGKDLLMIMDHVGIGVGATMHIVNELEMKAERGTRPKFTYSEDEAESD